VFNLCNTLEFVVDTFDDCSLTQQHSVRISAIGGWEPTSVGAEMKKAGFNQSDIDAVAKLFEDAMPNFAAEIKKQIPKQTKSRK
jgi:hypothetical protein